MPRKRRKGGQKGNRNSMKHGAYQTLSPDKIDGRTKTAKELAELEAGLVESIGGKPSKSQALIIRRAAVKALRCSRAEVLILAGKARPSLEEDYLRWANSLRRDLESLGLTGSQMIDQSGEIVIFQFPEKAESSQSWEDKWSTPEEDPEELSPIPGEV